VDTLLPFGSGHRLSGSTLLHVNVMLAAIAAGRQFTRRISGLWHLDAYVMLFTLQVQSLFIQKVMTRLPGLVPAAVRMVMSCTKHTLRCCTGHMSTHRAADLDIRASGMLTISGGSRRPTRVADGWSNDRKWNVSELVNSNPHLVLVDERTKPTFVHVLQPRPQSNDSTKKQSAPPETTTARSRPPCQRPWLRLCQMSLPGGRPVAAAEETRGAVDRYSPAETL